MEAAGLTVGVVALAGLFNNAVDCFDYVQAGRSFGKNSQICLTKLSNAQLRVSRWGESVGLSDLQNIQTLNGVFRDDQHVPEAQHLLGQILTLFAEAEGTSQKLTPTARLYSTQIASSDSTALVKLSDEMRQLAIKRQNHTSLKAKAKWALGQEKNFRRLLEDIIDLVKDLEDLFPAQVAKRQELCVQEVQTIKAAEVSAELKDIASSPDVSDTLLLQAIELVQKGQKPIVGSVTNTFSGKFENSKVFGQFIAHGPTNF